MDREQKTCWIALLSLDFLSPKQLLPHSTGLSWPTVVRVTRLSNTTYQDMMLQCVSSQNSQYNCRWRGNRNEWLRSSASSDKCMELLSNRIAALIGSDDNSFPDLATTLKVFALQCVCLTASLY